MNNFHKLLANDPLHKAYHLLPFSVHKIVLSLMLLSNEDPEELADKSSGKKKDGGGLLYSF